MFKLIHARELDWLHFEEYPVWSEYYEPGEIDEIVQWGVDRAWLLEQIASTDSGSDHAAYPVLRLHPLPERQFLFVRAQFETPRGCELKGYVINSNDRIAYAAVIISHGSEFVFNINLKDMARDTAERLALSLAVAAVDLFPMRYETGFRSHDGVAIAGFFSPV